MTQLFRTFKSALTATLVVIFSLWAVGMHPAAAFPNTVTVSAPDCDGTFLVPAGRNPRFNISSNAVAKGTSINDGGVVGRLIDPFQPGSISANGTTFIIPRVPCAAVVKNHTTQASTTDPDGSNTKAMKATLACDPSVLSKGSSPIDLSESGGAAVEPAQIDCGARSTFTVTLKNSCGRNDLICEATGFNLRMSSGTGSCSALLPSTPDFSDPFTEFRAPTVDNPS